MTVNIRKKQYNISIAGFQALLISKGFEIDEHILNIYLNTEEMKNLKEEINKLKLK